MQPANGTLSASGDGITVHTAASGVLARELRFAGSVPAADAGQVLEIERRAAGSSAAWLSTADATVQSAGAFTVTWQANRAGQFNIKAVLLNPDATVASDNDSGATGNGAASAGAGSSSAASPALTITVYRMSRATIYGPGLFGRETACGERLRRSTIGVASRTLKCGTKVSILYDGQSIVVPVIDRGPYANGADWDLTSATAADLGMSGTADVGAATVSKSA